MLAELIGVPAGSASQPGRIGLLAASTVAALMALLVVLAGPIPYSTTAQGDWHLDVLWRSSLFRQFTGYTLLGLSLLGLTLSLRKRWKRFTVGRFPAWRLAHAGLGAATLGVLVAHTGLRPGENLNLLLMASFLGLTLVGAVAGGVTALEDRIGGAVGQRLRARWTHAHIALAWPLPVLLAFHIVSAYYF